MGEPQIIQVALDLLLSRARSLLHQELQFAWDAVLEKLPERPLPTLKLPPIGAQGGIELRAEPFRFHRGALATFPLGLDHLHGRKHAFLESSVRLLNPRANAGAVPFAEPTDHGLELWNARLGSDLDLGWILGVICLKPGGLRSTDSV